MYPRDTPTITIILKQYVAFFLRIFNKVTKNEPKCILVNKLRLFFVFKIVSVISSTVPKPRHVASDVLLDHPVGTHIPLKSTRKI